MALAQLILAASQMGGGLGRSMQDSNSPVVSGIGGGMENSLSLLELINFLEKELSVTMKYENLPWRESDQKIFVADNKKIFDKIGWQPLVDKETGIKRMLNWIKNNNRNN